MRRLAIIVLATAAGVGLLAPPAGAASPSTSVARPTDAASDALAPVDVVQVSGLIDEILVDSITQSIKQAEANGSQALILQINSTGAVVSRDRMAVLLDRLHKAPVPIGIWVGPSGAHLYGCLLYTSPSPRDRTRSRMPSSA